MSKYKEMILAVLSKTEIKSTNQILEELQKKADKIINWHLLYRVLMDLVNENKIERLESKAGFFWRKK
jgi:Fe2+ or Zn2+ uptake regulation protein